MDGFVHLHVHSHYSLLDGANRIKDLVETARSFGMGSLAITDHGNLFGAVDFYSAAREAGIKPILGLEAYISPTTRQDRSMGNQSDACYHLILLAMNETGWRNLIRMSSRSYLEGFYYKPRIDRDLLAQFHEGLVCTTACLGGEVPTALLSNQPGKARRIAGEYRDIFGPERFFIEVQNNTIPEQDKVNPLLIELARELGVGIVGTNDVHFLRRDDKKAHEVLTAISTGKTLADGGALSYPPELYLKDVQEMHTALAAWPESIANTLRIAEMCNVVLDFSQQHLPKFATPAGKTPGQHLRELAWAGLRKRFHGRETPEEYSKRLEWELKVIDDKGYSSYFLIVNDFVAYARRNNIPAAPRGSGVATLLGYSLGIADVDPLRYGLLFERFTDPQRQEAPDLDIDICQEGRGKVLQYVREKYGHVAQIITYGTLKAKAVVRDVGRVLGVPLGEVDALCKKVPDALGMTLKKALEAEPELKRLHDSQPIVQQIIAHGQRLEGLARHAGVHAAGVIVCDKPLEDLVPLYKQTDSDDVITQWDGPTCDKIGLMKMDFLGLRTLTTIQRARELVRARTGRDMDPESLPLDDPKVFEVFSRGETDGIFQFESGGMKDVLMKMQPNRIEDLIAANAMYRPGPMELIPSYIARKNGSEPIGSVHPLVDGLLAETYGIMAYQEQVMQVLNRLGKLPLNRALTLIKAISKKKAKVIASERPNFLAGANENGISEADAQRLFDLILKFAGYGFNKAHSTRYAIVAYQTAYFKAYWPREFFAALLTFESGDTDKVVQYMAEAARAGVKVAPPDINACGADFAVDGEQVRFGLAAVKGVGDKAIEAILAGRTGARKFRDLFHFCKNVDLRSVNKSTIEALVKCGAFDSLGASRAAATAAIEQAISLGQEAAADRRSGQMSFFGAASGADAPPPRFPTVEPWSEAQLLAAEKETLGFYVTSHPLTRYARELTGLSSPEGLEINRLEDYGDGTGVTLGCMVVQIRRTVTKTGRSAGKPMAMLTVEDLTGKCDAVAFSETFERFGHLLTDEAMVFLRGAVDRRRERPSVRVDEIVPLDKALEELTGRMILRLGALATQERLKRLHDVLVRHRGPCVIELELIPLSRMDTKVVIRPDRQWFVSPTRAMVSELVGLLGEENVVLKAKPPRQDNGNGKRFCQRTAPAQQPAMFRPTPQQQEAQRAVPAAGQEVSAAVTRFN
jgi:DNA polymerase-3 subunit alpha